MLSFHMARTLLSRDAWIVDFVDQSVAHLFCVVTVSWIKGSDGEVVRKAVTSAFRCVLQLVLHGFLAGVCVG